MVNTDGWFALHDRGHWELCNEQGKFMAIVCIHQGDEWPMFIRWAKEAIGLTQYQVMAVIFETAWQSAGQMEEG